MKQILFRGKRKDNQEWVEGLKDSWFWNNVDMNTVGQYATIDDKNGNKIFKGHIVKRESMAPGGIDFIGTVVFREGTYLLDNGKDCIPLFTEIDTLEIIGNIHDNPEMIK